jgi:hypothetical protein
MCDGSTTTDPTPTSGEACGLLGAGKEDEMSKRDDGGSAFPSGATPDGMSLRDWFAGQALDGMGMWFPRLTYSQEDIGEQDQLARAKWAYAQADAMLKERVKAKTRP